VSDDKLKFIHSDAGVCVVACFCTKHNNRDEEDERLVNTQTNASTGYDSSIVSALSFMSLSSLSQVCYMYMLLISKEKHKVVRDRGSY